MEQALFDLGPALHLLIMGALVALLPLSWVWLRNPRASTSERVRVLTWLTVFITFDLVMFGAFTRLTDSGLGCPDWPGCYGHASPLGAKLAIQAAQDQMPTGPVTHTKAWIEMLHRYMAMAVGGLIVTLAGFAWFRRLRGEAQALVMWPTLSLVWVCVQGAFGALTVTMKLFPLIVTLHLMGGLMLLSLLVIQAECQRARDEGETRYEVSRWTYRTALFGLFLLVLQIALGGWVSTNYAVLACNTFPQCQGSWWPEMDFAQGFALWRPLGTNAEGTPLTFAALTAIHYVHRLLAYGVLLYLFVFAWRVRHTDGWQQAARGVMFLLALQLVTGLSNVVLGWPLLAAVMHTGGAAALSATLVWMLVRVRVARG